MKKTYLFFISSLLVVLFCSFFLASCYSITSLVEDAVDDVVNDAINDPLKVVEKVGAVVEAGVALGDNIEKVGEGISPEAEYCIGRSVAASILNDYPLYKNDAVTNYLNKICTTLALNSDKPYLYKGYFVAVIDSDEINAISTPGGHIFISRGLLNCVDSEDAIASVIAHELSHIQIGHSKSTIETERGLDLVKSIGTLGEAIFERKITADDVRNLNDTSDSIVRKLLRTGFSQSQEFEADENALILMNNAGYNPYALIDMLESIDKCTDSGKGWFGTHPKPKSRIKDVYKKLKQLKYTPVDVTPRLERFKEIKNQF